MSLSSHLDCRAAAAVLKRETDGEKGVNALKQRYKDVDAVRTKIEPYLNRMGLPWKDYLEMSAGWYGALTGPQRVQAAQHFLRNLNIDPAAVAGFQTQPQQQHNQGYDPQALQNYVQSEINRGIQEAQLNAAAQQQLNDWMKDKPYFQLARHEMYRLIAEREVPLLPDGNVDLDAAYNKAVEPIIDQLAKQQQQQEAARKAAAEKARRASSSLSTSTAPGQYVKRDDKNKGKGQSVRDTLRAAIDEHRAG